MSFTSELNLFEELKTLGIFICSKGVLGISTGLTDINLIRWDLAGCLLLAWIIVYCALWKGVKSIGKVETNMDVS